MDLDEHNLRALYTICVVGASGAAYLIGFVILSIRTKQWLVIDWFIWPYYRAWKLKGKNHLIIKVLAVVHILFLVVGLIMTFYTLQNLYQEIDLS